MAKKKILVMTDDMPWGHRSIAKAIYSFLKSKEKQENFEVFYAEAKANTGIAGEAYLFAYRYLPVSNKLAGWVSYTKVARRMVEETSKLNLPGPKKLVERFKPDLVISAYWFHSQSLAGWFKKSKSKIKLWTVVADPWSIMPVSYNKNIDLHLVYDEKGEKIGAEEAGISKEAILKTGWWTRPEMFQKYDKWAIRKKWGITDRRPVIFVGGGSLGTNSLPRLLPALLMIKKKVAFIFNTGTDRLAFNLVEEYIKLFRKMRRRDQVIIKNFGWIENMAETLAGVDIVFGKAGPNFLFDVVAQRKPFVAITHIGGQEDGNIDLIKEKKLGWVREKRGEAADFLLKYLEKPKYYQNKYKKNIALEAAKNKKSMGIILKKITCQK